MSENPSETKAKVVQITDENKGHSHTWLIASLPKSQPISAKGYRPGQAHYTLLETGYEEASHDLFELRREASMTDAEFEFLNTTDFADLDDGAVYYVGGN